MGEKLSRRGWLAVGLATLGVTVLIWGALDTLSISLSLAATFALYGMVRKLSPVESLPGLTMETALLLLPAVLWLVHLSGQNTGTSLHHHPNLIWLTALSGIVTATPLLLFAAAARRMDYSTLGFIQYISPTLAFLLGIFVFHEHLRPIQLLSFVIIWAALGIFIWDMLAKKSTT
jgi:chloramphenicol-sensitive protein RarD